MCQISKSPRGQLCRNLSLEPDEVEAEAEAHFLATRINFGLDKVGDEASLGLELVPLGGL